MTPAITDDNIGLLRLAPLPIQFLSTVHSDSSPPVSGALGLLGWRRKRKAQAAA